MHVPGLLAPTPTPTPTPDLAQAGPSLAFFPEAWLSEGMCQNSSRGPWLCQKTLALAPEAPGRGRSPVVLRGSRAHTHRLCASGRHCPKTATQ